MRRAKPRTILALALVSILPLVVLGILVVQRLGALNEERYDQEVVAARYAAELTADEILDGLRDHLRPWRESLTYAHGRGEVVDDVAFGDEHGERAGVADALAHEAEIRMPADGGEVVGGSRGQVINGRHVVAVGEQSLGEVGPDEPGAAGNQKSHAVFILAW